MAKTEGIQEHMEVIGSDGQHVGTVDYLDGPDKIKLTKSDPASGGEHHVIPADWVDHVDAHVHLNKPSRDVKAQWQRAG
jgi:hypothetical protein